jgi:cyclic pyranopterin phosphate synthase
MIPLAHPLAIHHAAIEFFTDAGTGEVRVESRVKAFERTGVEMEAMISVSIAALTIYDMCKSMDKGITINAVELLSKEGGKSGAWKREER